MPQAAIHPTPPALAERTRPLAKSEESLRALTPSLADAVFIILFLRLFFLGQSALFNDPGTGWHLRCGWNLWAGGLFPTTDLYSWTKAGQPWAQLQWLGDVAMVWLFQFGGYTALAVTTAIALAALFRQLYRLCLEAGATPLAAVLTTILAAGAASGHFLVRPHLINLCAILLVYQIAVRFAEGRLSGKWLGTIPLFSILWVNVHPGILGGIATLVLVAAGTWMESLRANDAAAATRRRAALLTLTALAMTGATLCTPYGLSWYAGVARILSLKSLGLFVDEWMPPDLASPDGRLGMLLIVLGWSACALSPRRISLPTLLILAFWSYESLGAARHLPILAILFAPHLSAAATQAGECFLAAHPGWQTRLLGSHEFRRREQRSRGGFISALFVLGLLALLTTGPGISAMGLSQFGPPSPPYSRAIIRFLDKRPPAGHMFNDVALGGHLIAHAPSHPVFMDDRFELYGDAFVRAYANAARQPWIFADELFRTWGIDFAVVLEDTPLARYLAQRPDFELTFGGEGVLVFECHGPTRADSSTGAVGSTKE